VVSGGDRDAVAVARLLRGVLGFGAAMLGGVGHLDLSTVCVAITAFAWTVGQSLDDGQRATNFQGAAWNAAACLVSAWDLLLSVVALQGWMTRLHWDVLLTFDAFVGPKSCPMMD
jgi:hypothetical protein